jgi:hypothetical protein
MAITSSSTRAQVLAQYNDNLSWEGSPSKAALALEAIRWLLVNRPKSISEGDRQLNYESLEDEKIRLEIYVANNSTASLAGRSSFTRAKAVNV